MVSDTLAKELESYRIGERVRALRAGKKLGLAQLAAHTGLSASMLSKIERGQIFPTLPTLLRIAMVFGVGLDHFFSKNTDRPLVEVVRADQRLRMLAQPGSDVPGYSFESLDYPVPDRKMESFYAEFPAGSVRTEPHAHDGVELIYVIDGKLELTVGEEPFVLGKGDAVYFDASVPHAYCRKGGARCSAIVVTTP